MTPKFEDVYELYLREETEVEDFHQILYDRLFELKIGEVNSSDVVKASTEILDEYVNYAKREDIVAVIDLITRSLWGQSLFESTMDVEKLNEQRRLALSRYTQADQAATEAYQVWKELDDQMKELIDGVQG